MSLLPSESGVKRVLIIEDDTDHSELIKSFISHEHDVTVCSSAEEALGKLEDEDFHLVISDVHLYGMTGLQVLEHMKRLNKLERCPVVFCSSERDPEFRQRAIAMGATEFIFKPFSADQFRLTIRALLAK